MLIHKLKVIKHQKAKIIKILKKKDIFFKKFGECYISEIKPKQIKAWRFHKKNSKKIFLLDGRCKIVILNKKKINSYILNSKIASLLIIPKNCWYGFKNLTNKKIKILNIIDNKYDENEVLRKEIKEIKHNWL